jgi:hypothetical protein
LSFDSFEVPFEGLVGTKASLPRERPDAPTIRKVTTSRLRKLAFTGCFGVKFGSS